MGPPQRPRADELINENTRMTRTPLRPGGNGNGAIRPARRTQRPPATATRQRALVAGRKGRGGRHCIHEYTPRQFTCAEASPRRSLDAAKQDRRTHNIEHHDVLARKSQHTQTRTYLHYVTSIAVTTIRHSLATPIKCVPTADILVKSLSTATCTLLLRPPMIGVLCVLLLL